MNMLGMLIEKAAETGERPLPSQVMVALEMDLQPEFDTDWEQRWIAVDQGGEVYEFNNSPTPFGEHGYWQDLQKGGDDPNMIGTIPAQWMDVVRPRIYWRDLVRECES